MEKGIFVFGLNAGGPQYVDSFGNLYQADTTGIGKSYSTTQAIGGTADDVLFQTEAYAVGGFTYEIALEPATYYVELNFAEIYSKIEAPGGRVFDVLLEGVLVDDNLDILADAGAPYTALSYGYFVNVTDGFLTLKTSAEVQNPKINAFSIWTAIDGGISPADTTKPTVQITASGGETATDPVSITINYSDAGGLDPATVQLEDLVATTSGPSVQILSQNLQLAADGRSATATYSVLPQGGWTSSAVAFSVAAGAVTDIAGNGNTAVSKNFAFQTDPLSGIAPVDTYGTDIMGVSRSWSRRMPASKCRPITPVRSRSKISATSGSRRYSSTSIPRFCKTLSLTRSDWRAIRLPVVLPLVAQVRPAPSRPVQRLLPRSMASEGRRATSAWW